MTRAFGAAILGCEGTRLSRDEIRFYSEAQPFGFILFLRNLDTADQIRALCADMRAAVGWAAPILIDQEGGRVQRLRPPLARDWLPPLDDVVRFGARAAKAMELRYRIIAAELVSLGINGNCAPMLDIARADTHTFLRNRCYAGDGARVIEIAKSVRRGLEAGGVMPVIKHIPGHGRAAIDSHLDVPRIRAERTDLAEDFSVFQAFRDCPLGMSAHLIFEAIDPRPATVSPVMIDMIRTEIGFDGFLMTDDISMEALSGTVGERSAAAVSAGCDAVLHCNGNLAEMQLVIENVGAMTADAQRRAEAALAAQPIAQTVDIDALEAEFEALSLEPPR